MKEDTGAPNRSSEYRLSSHEPSDKERDVTPWTVGCTPGVYRVSLGVPRGVYRMSQRGSERCTQVSQRGSERCTQVSQRSLERHPEVSQRGLERHPEMSQRGSEAGLTILSSFLTVVAHRCCTSLITFSQLLIRTAHSGGQEPRVVSTSETGGAVR